MKKWKELIKKLSDAGFTQQEIAEHAACSQSYIAAMATGARGKSVSFEIGSRLNNVLNRFENGDLLPKRARIERKQR